MADSRNHSFAMYSCSCFWHVLAIRVHSVRVTEGWNYLCLGDVRGTSLVLGSGVKRADQAESGE